MPAFEHVSNRGMCRRHNGLTPVGRRLAYLCLMSRRRRRENRLWGNMSPGFATW